MSRLSAVLYNVMFMQQVQTAGQMAALAAGHHELIVEVSCFSMTSSCTFGDCLG